MGPDPTRTVTKPACFPIPVTHHALSHPFSDMCESLPAKSLSPLYQHCLFNFSQLDRQLQGKNEAALCAAADPHCTAEILELSRCLGNVHVWARTQKSTAQPSRARRLSEPCSSWAHGHVSVSSASNVIVCFSLPLLSDYSLDLFLGHNLLLTTMIVYFYFTKKCVAHYLSSPVLTSCLEYLSGSS